MKIRLLILIASLLTIITADALGQDPTITSISPIEGPVGSLVTITGTNLEDLTALSIAGVTGLEISNDGSTVIGFVMPGATTGAVDVTTSFFGSTTVSSSQIFTVITPDATPALQLGADIDGQAASDESGYSVSLSADGQRVAIGAPGHDGTGVNAGQVRIYEWSGTAWGQVGLDIDGEAAGDQSGWSVSISANGQRVAIGALGNNGLTGHVRVYEDITGVWTKIGDDIDGEATGDQSGYSVSLSADGQRVAIGGRLNDANGVNAGHVRIYQDISGVWTQIGVDIDGENANDQSAFSVSLSADGQRVAIGAPFNAGNGSRSGQVHIFEDIAGTWTQMGVDIDGEAINEEYGWSVSLSADGQRVAIGATAVLTGSAGYTRIYEWSGSAWNKIADIDGEVADDRSGISVSLSADGQRVAIGARLNAGGGLDAGHVRIYEDIAGTWSQILADIDGEAAGNESGRSVSLSADGERLAIGAPFNNGNGVSAGHVRAFQLVNPLNLTSSTPASNTTNIATSANIVLTFDVTVDGTTANANNIKISGEQTGTILGAFSGGGTNTITFDPTNDFKAGEVITVTATSGLQSTFGNLAAEKTFQFTTASGPATTFICEKAISATRTGNALADLDGDGDVDVISSKTSSLVWLQNDGAGNFVEFEISANSFNGLVTATDLDSDGDMDIVLSYDDTDDVKWFENDGSENFTENVIELSGGQQTDESLHALDFDLDGDIDLLVSRFENPDIAWYENDGSQNFNRNVIPTNITDNGDNKVFPIDLDGDGDIDFLNNYEFTNEISWYENDGFQSFTQNVISTNGNGAALFAMDIDGDGDMDVLASTSAGNIVWYENNGSQTFTENTIDATASAYLTAADIDGDGDIDVMSASANGASSTIDIYTNNGSQVFAKNTLATGNIGLEVKVADMDNDSDLDLLGSFFFGDVLLLENTNGPLNLTSSTPTRNQLNIATDATVSFSFDANIVVADVHNGSTAAAQILDDNISIRGNLSGYIQGTWAQGAANSVVFTPANSFKAGEIITVTIHCGLDGANGTASTGDGFDFTVVAAAGPGTFPLGSNTINASINYAYPIDVDGDGDIDVVGTIGPEAVWYENDGNQVFTETVLGDTFGDAIQAVHATDLDSDGDIDFLFDMGGSLSFFENNGSQSFAENSLSVFFITGITSADMDRDGDIDLLVYDGDDINWLQNNGNQEFTTQNIASGLSSFTGGGGGQLYAVDMDDDGDLDVLTRLDGNDDILWYENDGSQTFTERTFSTSQPGFEVQAVKATDLDGDGDMDLVAAFQNIVVWFENNGSQVFTEQLIGTGSTSSVNSAHAADVNGDGNIDVIGSFQNETVLYVNDGAGSFNPEVIIGGPLATRYTVDMDMDGDLDILAYDEIVTDALVWYEQAPIPFLISSINPTSAPVGTQITISGSGFNLSGPNDIFFGPVKVTANANAAGTEILVNVPAGASSVTPLVVRNNSNGLQTSSINSSTPFLTLTVPGPLPLTNTRFTTTQYSSTIRSNAIAAGDFDNDGDVDIIIADITNTNNVVQFQTNDGNGVFSAGANIALASGEVRNLQVADLDGDGNLDIAAGKNGGLELFRGIGNGTFTAFPSPAIFSTVINDKAGLAIADINKDGNMDIVAANSSNEVSVLLGDGAGNFAHASYSPFIPTGLGDPSALDVADFNNDGFLDIALLDYANDQGHILLFNVAADLFDAPISFATGSQPFRLVTGYFNGDTNMDLAILNITSRTVEIYSADGAGNFSASGSPVTMGATPFGLNRGNFDGNGTTDLVAGGGNLRNLPLLQGDGIGGVSSFSTFPLSVTPSRPYGVISADFNNDGIADLAAGDLSVAGFTVAIWVRPVITSLSPSYGNVGETITITGEDFTGVTAVSFGGTPAESFLFVSDTEITAVVAAGSTSGAVEVTTADGTASLDGFMFSPFVTTWVTDNGSIIIPTAGSGYNYDVAWSNLTNPGTGEGSLSGRTGNTTIFGLANTDVYEVRISGVFPRINFGGSTFQNQQKIRSIEQWGNNPWTSMEGAFESCRNMVINAADAPDLSNVTSLASMFVGVREATAFTNTDLSAWDVSTITDMSYLFNFAWFFNQDISNWDVSNVTNMAYMFGGAYAYNQPLNSWDVSNVVNMELMFFELDDFNQPLDLWDVSNVQFMNGMFSYTKAFNQPLNGWNVSSVTTMQEMFGGAEAFNQPLDLWDVSSVTDMSLMFSFNIIFNQDISTWNVSSVTDMWQMFQDATAFNQDISGWNTSSATDMWRMFRDATAFDQDLGSWDVSNVFDMDDMLSNSGLSTANYDATLIGWSSLTTLQPSISLGALNLNYCTAGTERQILTNAPNNWIITDGGAACDIPSQTTDINFPTIDFTQVNLSWTNGDGSNRIIIAKEGGPVDANPVDLATYSADAAFGNPATEIGTGNFVVYNGNGNTLTVTNLVAGETYHFQAFEYNGPSGLEAYNTDATAFGNPASLITLIAPTIASFSPINAKQGETVTILGTDFTNVAAVSFGGTAANSFTVVSPTEISAVVGAGSSGSVEVVTAGGTANLASFMFNPFVTRWRAAGGTITIPTAGTGYNYEIRWTNISNPGNGDGSGTGTDGNFIISSLASGDTYEVAITGAFPRIFINFGSTRENLLSIEQWGDIVWGSMEGAFYGARFLEINAPDAPDLSNVSSLSAMFSSVEAANAFTNTDLSLWDVSTITDMSFLFERALFFNQNISNWTVGGVLNMENMFAFTTTFNQPIGTWDVSSVNNMDGMFIDAFAFNQPLNGWTVSSVTRMSGMFRLTEVFDQPLNNWDVSNVTSMNRMFASSKAFDQPIEQWTLTSLEDMTNMFAFSAAFNQPLGQWDVSNVIFMEGAFLEATAFNQSLGNWDISGAQTMNGMLESSILSVENYDATLTGWATLDAGAGETIIPENITLDAIGLNYCASIDDRQILLDTYFWSIDDAGGNCSIPSQASAISFSNIGTNQADVSWINGGGGNRLVIAKEGSPVDANPIDLVSYSASATFGDLGAEIGTSNFVVYNGNANNFTVNGLNEGLTYHFQVFEYNGLSGIENYNTDATATGNPSSVTTFVTPSVTSFAPGSAGQGQPIIITGSDFTSATAVNFGGSPATSFIVDSDSQITAIIGNGTSGNIEVTTPGGTASISNFVFINAPIVDSFSPATAAEGETVTLTGSNFSNATAVSFGGTAAASFTVVSDTEITAVIGAGTSGNILVTTPGGTITLAGFTFIPAPTISGFSPATAALGETVTLTGSNFTDASAVSFGGTAATTFTVVSDTEITAVIGAGSSGSIVVSTPGGTITLAGFTFIPAPTISTFTPATAAQGETVTLTGSNFTNATAVSFGGTAATTFTVVSDTEITAVIGAGSSGSIVVSTPGGTITLPGFTFIPAPTISGFSPATAALGETVTLTGSNFSNATAVSFGGTAATTFTVVSDTEITAVIGAGSSGNILVTTPGGTITLAGFTFIPAPTIGAFSPATAALGETVTLTGSNFSNATAVGFGGTAATTFTVVSDTEITAVIGAGSSGNILVTTPGGTITLAGFTFIPAPTISGFSPATAAEGETVTLTGSNFTNATAVSFGGTAATSFTVVSDTEITAVVGAGASGNILVTAPGGTITLAGFTFIPAPTISGFSPATAAQGETVTLTGANFSNATAVSFGGTAATTFTVVSDTEITAVIGAGSSGNILVTTPGGTITLTGFTFIPAPTISGFSPATAAQGETVTLTGANFSNATAVSFGGTAATTFTVVSDTEITAVIGAGSSGSIVVSTPGGTITLPGFTFIPAPTISGFSPATAAEGETVTLTGTNFTNATAVSFGGTAATTFTVVSDTEIAAVIGAGASGNILVTTPGGTITLAGFTFISAPIISAFDPATAAEGQTVTLTGANFSNATAVSFGGTAAVSFTVVSDTEITAIVGSGTSGDIVVNTNSGMATIAGFVFIPAPTIVSFSPASARVGETVSIIGTNFTNASAVGFGGTAAASFTVVSATEITAIVGSGSSGEVMVTTPGGTAIREGFTLAFSQIVLYQTEDNLISSNQSEAVNLGSILTRETLDSEFIISNTGNANLLISSISSSNDAFEVISVVNTVNPTSTRQFVIRFTAPDFGRYESEIRIINNSINSPDFVFNVTAELTGLNVIDNETESVVISNQDINLGSTPINVNVDKDFNIENLSPNAEIIILSITVDNPVFQIINIPTSIPPASSVNFTVRLNADRVGEYTGIVTVRTNVNEFSFQVAGVVLPEASTEIKVFNVITPNGDGRHDYLEMENITEYPNNTVSIFNRWGNKVFEINNYNNVDRIFEGTSDNGEELISGNYYYVIDKGNGDRRQSGFLIIKR